VICTYSSLQFGTLRTLTTLWLDDNEFETFPTCVCQLKSLKSLRLSGNSIKTVPNLISSMEGLETLVSAAPNRGQQ
jgi:Leucine-rich repeat (LRR) protein